MNIKAKNLKTLSAIIANTLFLSVLVISAQTSADKTKIENLPLGKNIERPIKGGETQEFGFKLKKGEFARVEVIPTQIDLIVSLFDENGKSIIEMNGDSSYLWRESVSVIAEQNGTFKLQIKGKDKTDYGQSGYIVNLAEQRKSVALDTKRIEAEKQIVQAIKLQQEDKNPESTKAFETALNLWREVGDKFWEANVMWNLAFAHYLNSSYKFSETDDEPLKLYGQALKIFQSLNDRTGEAAAFNGIGIIYRFGKKYELAKENFEKSLVIRKELNRLKGEYNTLSALLIVYYNLKRDDKVLENQNRMIEIAEQLNDKNLKADTIKAGGQFYLDTKRYAKAVELYEKALPIYQELKDTKNEIFLRQFLGLMYGQIGEFEKAKDHLERYAELSKESGSTENWMVYQNLGLLYRALQQDDKVIPNYEKALELTKALKDNRQSESYMMSLLGSYYSDKGDYQKAKKLLEEALSIAKQNKDLTNEHNVLQNLAYLYIKLKDFEKAENFSEQALAIRRTLSKYDEGNALLSTGVIYLNTGKPEKAREKFLQALEKSRETDDSILKIDSLSNLGFVSSISKQFEEAEKYYIEAKDLAGKLNNRRKLVTTLDGLGSVYSAQSKFKEAKSFYEESIRISETLLTKLEINTVYNNLAATYLNLSEFQNAKEYSEKALKLAQDRKEQITELIALINLGRIYANLNQYDKAREYFEKVLKISQETKNPFGEYDAVTGLGFIYINLGNYDKAKELVERAEKISQEVKTISPTDVFYARGAMYVDLSSPEKAAGFIQQSLELAKNAKNRRGEGVIIAKLAEISMQNKKYEEAKSYYEQSLAIARDVKNPADESAALISLGEVYLNLNKFVEAKANYERSLELARRIDKPANASSALNGLGELAFKQKEFDKALGFYQQALPTAKETQLKNLESRILKNMMNAFKELKKSQAAIIYGKQAVDIYQEIRGNIKKFEKESQQSFVKDKEETYRTLANLLIDDDRFFEAQTVLNLLKEEEYSQLTQTGEKSETIPYSDIENELLESSAKLAAVQSEFDELQKIEEPTAEQLQKLGEKRREKDGAKTDFENILKKLAAAESSVAEQINRIYQNKNDDSFQNRAKNLQTKTTGVVGLYTLIGREKNAQDGNERNEKNRFGWVILVAGEIQRAYPIDVNNFNRNVFNLRDALGSDKYDPQQLSEKIYNAIFRQKSPKTKTTLEQDLDQILGKYPNKTLMWSLDGVLRYIPMAALHDGKNYLVEKYLNTVFTDKSLSSLVAPEKTDWTILGVGVSESRENFAALPGVKTELESIVREQNSVGGILDGTIKLNGNFKKELFFKLLKDDKYQAVHIASHYSFNPRQQQNSFLLVGDGHLVFSELNDETLFGNLDLLTLSACDTGASGNGLEAEGFPIKAQQLGAKSVLASLWKISDSGTPELMIRFYKLRSENQQMTKGEAFRRSQLSLLYGETKPEQKAQTDLRGTKIAGNISGVNNLPLFIKSEKAPFAHPHYWASFVLIGNWR